MKDETKAGILGLSWVTLYSIGLLLQSTAGYLIAIFSTVLAIIIIIGDERAEKQRKRAERYRNKFHKEYNRE